MAKLKKIFIASFIFLFLFSFNSYSEIVKKIELKGNQRISLETIVIFADIIIDKDYQSSDINLLIKKLYETTFFSDIGVELKNNVLTITVKENPLINTIVFKNEKAKKYIDTMKEFLTLREKTSFMQNYVKEDVNKIKEFYRQLGFYFAKIDVEIEKLSKNRVNLVYLIDKGEKAKISKIYFLGDKKIRDKTLRDVITSQEARFWKFISRNVYLNRSRIELDKRLLKNYYKNKGYYEVNISTSNVEYSESEGFVLTYSIDAGKRYRFSKIYLDVASELDQSAFISLEDEFNNIVGDYYSQKKLTNLLEKIDELSEQKELQFINHGITESLEGENIEVKVSIYEGKKFTIERVNIVGNSVTNDSVIRGELIVDEGDPYSALLVNKSLNNIRARGIFDTVSEKITEGSSPDLKVLEISVIEKATGEITAGAGVGTDGTAFMASISENNWLGRGIKLQSSLDVTEETISGAIRVINPNYNYSGNAVSASLDVSSSDKTANSGYKSSKTGFSVGTDFEQYQNVFFSPEISVSFEDIEAESSASTRLKKMEGNYSNIDFVYGIAYDKRNQTWQPTDGFRTKFIQSLPLVQDGSSILNGFDVSAYHEVNENIVGAVKFFARSIHGINDEDVRLTSRLFIPQNRLRGFNTPKVGPKDREDYIGGNYVSTLQFEAQLPKLLPESTRTDVSVFFDSGNVWGVDYDSSLDETNKIRSAIGISANVFTTVGPLSFTLAQDLSKATNDDSQLFNFRLGTSF
tara:strand:+ start:1986 stop:4232 length:2247 start_codon:yes stop_codon:yes gene_type:complete